MKSKLCSLPFYLGIIVLTQHMMGQTVELTPLYNTIGITVRNITGIDSISVEYKPTTEHEWRTTFPLDNISINSEEMMRGSMFGLAENTTYDLRVTAHMGSVSTTILNTTVTTLQTPSFQPSGTIRWVSPDGTGDFSRDDPGNLATLFASGLATCGTTIILKDGVYRVQNLQLTLNRSCTENTPIVLTADSGASPVVDAGTVVTTQWVPHPTKQNVYSTPTPEGTAHSTICLLGSIALYPYASVDANVLFGNYNLADLSFGYDGFVRDENTLYIATMSGVNPNDSVVRISNGFRFLTVNGNNHSAFLKVHGIDFRYFGKPVLNSFGSSTDSYSAIVFDFRNVNHVYFDHCSFTHNTLPVSFTGQCNNIVVQGCTFTSGFGLWSHAMIKKSNSFAHSLFSTVSSSRGRGVELSAIFIERSTGVTIRSNTFYGLNSAIESFAESGLNQEVDIYNNVFTDNFDAIECDGPWSNLRIWSNVITRPMAALSAAPPLIGPRYFFRNVVHGLTGRRNEKDDPYFVGCYPVSDAYFSAALGVKTNSGYSGTAPAGNLYCINNTFYSADTLGFVMAAWESEWQHALFANNIFAHGVSTPFYFHSLADTAHNTDFQFESVHDNFFTYTIHSPIARVKHRHGQYDCTDIHDVHDLQTTLSTISGSSNISIHNPYQTNPEFVSPTHGNFALAPSSPLIDAGIRIQGLYDYSGNSPDIGAIEFNSTSTICATVPLSQTVQLYPNPSNGSIHVLLPTAQSGTTCRVYNSFGQIVWIQSDVSDTNLLIHIESASQGVYVFELYTDSASIIRKPFVLFQ